MYSRNNLRTSFILLELIENISIRKQYKGLIVLFLKQLIAYFIVKIE